MEKLNHAGFRNSPALEKIRQELVPINKSAVESLQEGLEETLTLHRLGLSTELSKSLCLESAMSQLGQYTDKFDRWHNSDQILRWSCASLSVIEPRLRKIRGFRYLKILRYKMQEEIRKYQEHQTQQNKIERLFPSKNHGEPCKIST